MILQVLFLEHAAKHITARKKPPPWKLYTVTNK